MTQEEITKLFERKNMVEVLSYTMLGLSAVKERFKEFKNDLGAWNGKLLEGVDYSEELVKKYLVEILYENPKKDKRS